MCMLAKTSTTPVNRRRLGTDIHAGVGSASTANGPSDIGTGTRD